VARIARLGHLEYSGPNQTEAVPPGHPNLPWRDPSAKSEACRLLSVRLLPRIWGETEAERAILNVLSGLNVLLKKDIAFEVRSETILTLNSEWGEGLLVSCRCQRSNLCQRGAKLLSIRFVTRLG
jgi:hypothetical protein